MPSRAKCLSAYSDMCRSNAPKMWSFVSISLTWTSSCQKKVGCGWFCMLELALLSARWSPCDSFTATCSAVALQPVLTLNSGNKLSRSSTIRSCISAAASTPVGPPPTCRWSFAYAIQDGYRARTFHGCDPPAWCNHPVTTHHAEGEQLLALLHCGVRQRRQLEALVDARPQRHRIRCLLPPTGTRVRWEPMRGCPLTPVKSARTADLIRTLRKKQFSTTPGVLKVLLTAPTPTTNTSYGSSKTCSCSHQRHSHEHCGLAMVSRSVIHCTTNTPL
jgi:hypothetical protein